MKSVSHKLLLTFVVISVFRQDSLKAMNVSSVIEGISKGVEIAGYVATGVDTAMNVANLGVMLWGSDKDRARMAKGMQITGLITSIAKGDFESAEAHAESIRGSKSDAQYTSLTAEELAEADIVPAESVPVTRSFGDIDKMSDSEVAKLRKNKKTITIDNTKLAQFGILKNQLVFEAQLPKKVNEEKMYELMNGIEILFKAEQDRQDSSKLNIVCYRLFSTDPKSLPKGKKPIVTKHEFVTIALSKKDLQKNFFLGTTNNELSIFHKEGNAIVKTTLIQQMT